MNVMMMREVSMRFHLVLVKNGGPAFGQSVTKIVIARFESQQWFQSLKDMKYELPYALCNNVGRFISEIIS